MIFLWNSIYTFVILFSKNMYLKAPRCDCQLNVYNMKILQYILNMECLFMCLSACLSVMGITFCLCLYDMYNKYNGYCHKALDYLHLYCIYMHIWYPRTSYYWNLFTKKLCTVTANSTVWTSHQFPPCLKSYTAQYKIYCPKEFKYMILH